MPTTRPDDSLLLSDLSLLAPFSKVGLKEIWMRVGAVYICVTDGARLILCGLVMCRPGGNWRRGKVRRRRMALQANGVDVGAIQQARIRPTVGEVAGSAALRFD